MNNEEETHLRVAKELSTYEGCSDAAQILSGILGPVWVPFMDDRFARAYKVEGEPFIMLQIVYTDRTQLIRQCKCDHCNRIIFRLMPMEDVQDLISKMEASFGMTVISTIMVSDYVPHLDG